MSMERTVAGIIGQSARRFGKKTALVFEDQRWSFAQIDAVSSALAASLVRLGVRQGEVVSLFSPNRRSTRPAGLWNGSE